jgi:malonyl CoA-acyl carrier protein transacylase
MRAILFPGQGAQFKGMGKDLFALYPDVMHRASTLLGYDLEELCLYDHENKLSQTRYTQPALYTVNALAWFEEEYTQSRTADFFLGHSLGEYNALLAAGAFDFETGLQLVKKRGELMGATSGGAMLAVSGLQAEEIEHFLHEHHLEGIDLANYNTQTQTVIAGQPDAIRQADAAFRGNNITTIPLKVSAPFHSRYMTLARTEFAEFIKTFTFTRLKHPVIANMTARPYNEQYIPEMLSDQITHPVLWRDSIRYLLGQHPEMEFQEIGSTILSKMVKQIKEKDVPLNLCAATASKRDVQRRPDAKKKKLFCLTYAGGDYRSFIHLDNRFQQVQLVPFEYSGRGRRMSEPLLPDIELMADDLYVQISPHLHEPYALYGHSLGARLAFLLCQRIRQRKGTLPEHLFVSGEPGPSLATKEKNTWTLPSQNFWQHLKDMGGCPTELFQFPDLMHCFEPIIRSDFQALSSYTYRKEAPLDLPITVMVGDHENVNLAEAKLWQQETKHLLTVFVFPGDHFFFKQHWAAITELVETSLRDTS